VSPRRIYVDIDDVLSETIEALVDLFEEMHDRRVDPQAVEHFDLSLSFGLDESEIDSFMNRAHEDDVLLSLTPISGAADVLTHWNELGRRVTLVTGRPPSTNTASRRWLEDHGLSHDTLHHLDKWNRPSWNRGELPAIRFEDIPDFEFDFAVEDSLETAVRLVEEFGIPVALMDRPWNRSLDRVSRSTRASLIRCHSWEQISEVVGGS